MITNRPYYIRNILLRPLYRHKSRTIQVWAPQRPESFWKCAQQLAKVYTDTFNWSLNLSKMPNFFKEAIIVPVPKEGNSLCLNDYRPVVFTFVPIFLSSKQISGRCNFYLIAWSCNSSGREMFQRTCAFYRLQLCFKYDCSVPVASKINRLR